MRIVFVYQGKVVLILFKATLFTLNKTPPVLLNQY